LFFGHCDLLNTTAQHQARHRAIYKNTLKSNTYIFFVRMAYRSTPMRAAALKQQAAPGFPAEF
jgi:hypothetical protein